MPATTETLEITGHVIDSMLFTRILDQVREALADYEIEQFDVGRTLVDPSYARLKVIAEDPEQLEGLIQSLMGLGMTRVETGEASLAPAEIDGVLPDGFYSSTNLETEVRVDGHWLRVENPEMDCAIVVREGRARTAPMSDVPKGAPVVVHTGAGPAMVRLIEAGYVDLLFAGNALAAHDIEGALYGTSLGVNLAEGIGVEHGHEHHIRALNTIRRCGSVSKAVEQGVLTSGIMHACITRGVDYVLGGSVRDDGPLPDTVTDVIEAQRQMRSLLPGVGCGIMVATMLHSIATGNLLPASVPLVCVDINPATVTKLADRGSTQTTGVVTDV